MSPFNALYDEFKGVFGKAYVLAGMIPAAVVVGSLLVYFSESSGQQIVDSVAHELGQETWTTAALITAVIAVVGLLFFALRSVVMTTVQTLGGRLLSSVRYFLTRMQVRAELRANRARETNETDYTILSKWVSDLDFEKPTYIPPSFSEPSVAQLKESSSAGIAAMEKHLSGKRPENPPTRGVFKEVRKALRDLYTYNRHKDGEVSRTQISSWRCLLEREHAKTTLTYLAEAAHRDLVVSMEVADQFPEETKWMQPTRLGNRAASLDDYAEKRYGIDTTTIVSRLIGLLSESERKHLSDGRIAVETSLNLMTASVAIFIVVGVDGLRETIETLRNVSLSGATPNWRALAVTIMSLAAARVFYLGALRAYSAMAEHIMRTVDLNRLKLIKGFGLPIPDNMASERELWEELSMFLKTGIAITPPPPISGDQGE